METLKTPYSDNLQALLATVTYLGAADFGEFQGRTLPAIVDGVGAAFSKSQIETVLNSFPGFIRRTKTDFYNLHLRFAHRVRDGEDYRSPPLNSQELSALLDLIATMVAHEEETKKLFVEQREAIERMDREHKAAAERLSRDIAQRDRTRNATLIASVIAAAAAMIAAVLSAFLKSH